MDKDEIKNETVTEETPTEQGKRPSEEQGSTEADSPNVAEEYLNNWKKERADFINYKKGEAKRIEEFVKFANEDLILEIVEVLDDLELAVKELKNMGLEQIVKKFNDLFKKYGVERIDTGNKFDPNLHEAIEIEQGGGKMAEVRAGYTMHGKVVRPARVRLTK